MSLSDRYAEQGFEALEACAMDKWIRSSPSRQFYAVGAIQAPIIADLEEALALLRMEHSGRACGVKTCDVCAFLSRLEER